MAVEDMFEGGGIRFFVKRAGNEDGSDPGDQAGDAVNEMDATGVMEFHLVLEPRVQVGDANATDETSDGADHKGHTGFRNHIASGADGDTAGQSGVLDDHHVELAIIDAGIDSSDQRTGGDAQIRVDDGTLLTGTALEGRVETGPVDIEEKRSHEGDHIGVVAGIVLLVVDGLLVLEKV